MAPKPHTEAAEGAVARRFRRFLLGTLIEVDDEATRAPAIGHAALGSVLVRTKASGKSQPPSALPTTREDEAIMIQLGTCGSCDGFLGIAVLQCPHCAAPLGRARRVVAGMAGLVGGGAVSMTLMACYGPGCVSESCGDYLPHDAGRTAADARVNPLVTLDGATDAAADATSADDGGLDGGRDADAAALDASDASFDAPSEGG